MESGLWKMALVLCAVCEAGESGGVTVFAILNLFVQTLSPPHHVELPRWVDWFVSFALMCKNFWCGYWAAFEFKWFTAIATRMSNVARIACGAFQVGSEENWQSCFWGITWTTFIVTVILLYIAQYLSIRVSLSVGHSVWICGMACYSASVSMCMPWVPIVYIGILMAG